MYVQGNEIADELARGGSSLGFLGPEPALGVSIRDIQTSSIVGWLTSIGQDGEVLAIPKGRLGN